MNDKAAPPGRRFEAEIYRDLDRKLKTSRWNSGASEAHGLLSALACRGVSGDRLRTRTWLLQLSEKADLDLLDGMYGLILRDLQGDGFRFSLLLPPQDHSGAAHRIESLADWCEGFIQGFFHDGWGGGGNDSETLLAEMPDRVRESVHDIMTISRVQAGAEDGEQRERRLLEIEEYLRVAVQVIFEELNPGSRRVADAGRAN